jgi:carbon-monoxide dehydrogenase medium subunit
MRLSRAEDLLKGKIISNKLIQEAGKIASEDCEPSSDLRGSEAYKRSVTNTLTKDMINSALRRAK